ncbi:hypothetical protein V8E53_004548 [Lactarius tabidus]
MRFADTAALLCIVSSATPLPCDTYTVVATTFKPTTPYRHPRLHNMLLSHPSADSVSLVLDFLRNATCAHYVALRVDIFLLPKFTRSFAYISPPQALRFCGPLRWRGSIQRSRDETARFKTLPG